MGAAEALYCLHISLWPVYKKCNPYKTTGGGIHGNAVLFAYRIIAEYKKCKPYKTEGGKIHGDAVLIAYRIIAEYKNANPTRLRAG